MIGIAYWHECKQDTDFWMKRGISQLAKCATAAGLRMAFPQDTSSLYIPEEMPPVQNEETVECHREQKKLSNKITPTDGIECQTKQQTATASVEKEKPLTEAEKLDREEVRKLRVYIYNFAQDHNISVETAEIFGKDLGLTCNYKAMTRSQLEKFQIYLNIRILMQKNNLTVDDLNMVAKKVSDKKLVDMDIGTLEIVYETIYDMVTKRDKTNNEAVPEPSEDNMPEEALPDPDEVTKENLDDKLTAIAESDSPNDSKKK